jgi:hypothetical protein
MLGPLQESKTDGLKVFDVETGQWVKATSQNVDELVPKWRAHAISRREEMARRSESRLSRVRTDSIANELQRQLDAARDRIRELQEVVKDRNKEITRIRSLAERLQREEDTFDSRLAAQLSQHQQRVDRQMMRNRQQLRSYEDSQKWGRFMNNLFDGTTLPEEATPFANQGANIEVPHDEMEESGTVGKLPKIEFGLLFHEPEPFTPSLHGEQVMKWALPKFRLALEANPSGFRILAKADCLRFSMDEDRENSTVWLTVGKMFTAVQNSDLNTFASNWMAQIRAWSELDDYDGDYLAVTKFHFVLLLRPTESGCVKSGCNAPLGL